MDVNRRNRNWYNCRSFGHLAKNYRNRETGDRIGKDRILEYENMNDGQNGNNNSNEE